MPHESALSLDGLRWDFLRYFFSTYGQFPINVRRTFRFPIFLAPAPHSPTKSPHKHRYQSENIWSLFENLHTTPPPSQITYEAITPEELFCEGRGWRDEMLTALNEQSSKAPQLLWKWTNKKLAFTRYDAFFCDRSREHNPPCSSSAQAVLIQLVGVCIYQSYVPLMRQVRRSDIPYYTPCMCLTVCSAAETSDEALVPAMLLCEGRVRWGSTVCSMREAAQARLQGSSRCKTRYASKRTSKRFCKTLDFEFWVYSPTAWKEVVRELWSEMRFVQTAQYTIVFLS